jgi:hypothetical protein
MEKNWERFAKMFSDKLVFNDKCIYPRAQIIKIYYKILLTKIVVTKVVLKQWSGTKCAFQDISLNNTPIVPYWSKMLMFGEYQNIMIFCKGPIKVAHCKIIKNWALKNVVTLALGLQGCGPKGRPRNHLTWSQECKECEGMNPHTPKWTLMLGVPNGPPNFQSAISGVKTHQFKEFFVSLETY